MHKLKQDFDINVVFMYFYWLKNEKKPNFYRLLTPKFIMSSLLPFILCKYSEQIGKNRETILPL